MGRCAVMCGAAVMLAWALGATEGPLFTMPPEGGDVAARFNNPPPSSRILPIRHVPSDDLNRQAADLKSLAERGFGGWAGNVSFDGYVDNEAKWPSFLYSVKASREAGMALWLYDECGYPSGSARDLTLRDHPELEARGLLVAVADVSAGERVSLELPPGGLLAARAVPVRDGVLAPEGLVAVMDRFGANFFNTIEDVDITVAADGHGQLAWKAPAQPAGTWRLFAMTDSFLYESTHAQISLAYKKPYVNLLMKEATDRFIAETHARYAAHLGDDLGKWFTSTFTDEPSLMSFWFKPMPYYVLPFAPGLPEDYRNRTGRSLFDDVPALIAEAGPRTPQKRYDFWNLIGDLVSENYFGTLRRWCNAHNFHSGGHLLMEEGIDAHVPLYGDFFRCLRQLDAPSIDCLQSIPQYVPWQTALLAGSAAALNGNRYVMCEASDHCQRYRAKGDTTPVVQVTEQQILGSLNRLVWGGVNTFTSYYRWEPFDTETVNRINRQIGRCITLLGEGVTAADIAVLYPAETLMSGYQPQLKGAGGALCRRAAQVFQQAGRGLFSANRCFMYVDSRSIAEAKREDDVWPGAGTSLRYRDLRWKVVILPCAQTLPVEALRNLHAFWKAGGVVIALDLPPRNSTAEFPSDEVSELSRELFGGADAQPDAVYRSNAEGGVALCLPSGQSSLLPHWLDRIIEPHVMILSGGKTMPIRTAHRRGASGDLFFVINDSDRPWEGTVSFRGLPTLAPSPVSSVERWNPADGTHAPFTDREEPAILSLPAYGAVLFTSRASRSPRRLPLWNGSLSTLSQTVAEPEVSVTLGARQKDLETALKDDPSASYPHRAEAKVVTGGVDTFCFTSYLYARPIIPQGAEGLVIDVNVPQRQDYAPGLLVFVQTRQGGRYLANAQHPLSRQGPARIILAFNQFEPFGGTVGALDPGEIVRVEIGWGGYFGTAGEILIVETRPPQLFFPKWGI